MGYMENLKKVTDAARRADFATWCEGARTLDARQHARTDYGTAEALTAHALHDLIREWFTAALETAEVTPAWRVAFIRSAPNFQPNVVMRVLYDVVNRPLEHEFWESTDALLDMFKHVGIDDSEWNVYLADRYTELLGLTGDENTADVQARVEALVDAEGVTV